MTPMFAPSQAYRAAGALGLALAAALLLGVQCGSTHEPEGFQTFTSPQASPLAISPDGRTLAVANTTSGTVELVSTARLGVLRAVEVGLEPVSVAFRPGADELWVANHLSDSVSVVDFEQVSPTFGQVVATVQDVGPDGVTRFDEPVGIAFTPDGSKAYVALSTENRVAVVDAATRQVTGRLLISAQDPRALTVRDGLLYVASFESGNRTQLSFCTDILNGTDVVGDPCSLGLLDAFTFGTGNPNIPGNVKNIVVEPNLPDRDLFVFDTATDQLVSAVEGVGTLLYGVAVDGTGRVFVTQTDALNDANGDHGQVLADLDNRMFLNQITSVDCSASGCGAPERFDLEPRPPQQPARSEALATPYGVAVSDDDRTLVATAMGTSRLFTMDVSAPGPSGWVIQDRLDLHHGVAEDFGRQIPRGVALASDPETGAPERAYVLNTLENTVSVVDVSDPTALQPVAKIEVGSDPTPEAVRRGRIAFMNAFASDTATFSCESCHPDGNTDQLLWRIGGECEAVGCDPGHEPRTTMPIRGLDNTFPFHWDGTLGDPFGGGNGSVGVGGDGGTSCTLGDADGAHDCFLDLVEGSLAGVMCDPNTGPCPSGGRQLSAQEQDDMASFLAEVAYPPARRRPPDDLVSAQALEGFEDFFTDQGSGSLDVTEPNTCADSNAGCHELPLGVTTNSPTLGAFDAPTMRGMNDRFVQFSIGITAVDDVLSLANQGIATFLVTDPLEPSIRWEPETKGFREITTFGAAFAIFQPVYNVRPLNSFQMFEEASTGFSGAVGRQVTLDASSTASGRLADTDARLAELEAADTRGGVNLRGSGVWAEEGSTFDRLTLSYRAGEGLYLDGSDSLAFSRAELLAEAQAGRLVLTLTGKLRRNFGSPEHPQPLIAANAGTATAATGDPDLPAPAAGVPLELEGVDVRGDAEVLVNGGLRPDATVDCLAGTFDPFCTSERVAVTLASVPAEGLHLLQVRNAAGPASPELPFCVGPASGCQ